MRGRPPLQFASRLKPRIAARIATPPKDNLLSRIAESFPEIMTTHSDGLVLRRATDREADGHVYNRSPATAMAPLSPCIAKLWPVRRGTAFRLCDDEVAQLGMNLQAGRTRSLHACRLLDDYLCAVNFLDPNASKALHIGHLRNLTLGQALACMLEGSGAKVSRISFVGDWGRHMAEATIGFRNATDGTFIVPQGIKPDHFIGRAYASLVATFTPQHKGQRSTDRECLTLDDEADQLCRAWSRQDALTEAQTRRTRDLVMAGQKATLETLGVRFDTVYCESDFLRFIEPLLERGCELGLWNCESSGAVIHHSSRPECPALLLARDGRIPTEHARLLSLILAVLASRPNDEFLIFLAGDEWRVQNLVHYDLLKSFTGQNLNDRIDQLYCGMIYHAGSTMKSSCGDALLIDDCLSLISEMPRTINLAAKTGGLFTELDIAGLLIRAHLLTGEPETPMRFPNDIISFLGRSPAWQLIDVLCDSWSNANTNAPACPLQPGYRFAVIASQDLWRKATQSIAALNPSILLRFLLAYARSICQLEAQKEPATAAVASETIRVGLRNLGLLPSTRITA
jgi:tRNA synthetases class I (R)